MIVGVPTEVKNGEFRVAITPAGVRELTSAGHTVLMQSGAGIGSSIRDDEFVATGASVLTDAIDVWSRADMVLKVKEPVPDEYPLLGLKRDQVLFTYLHPRRLAGLHRSADGRRNDRHRLRDSAASRWISSPAHPHE